MTTTAKQVASLTQTKSMNAVAKKKQIALTNQ